MKTELNDFQKAHDDLRHGRILRNDDFDGENIKAIRKSMGYTQVEFALYLNVGIDTVRSWESGRRRPGDDACTQLRSASQTASLNTFAAADIVKLRQKLMLSEEQFAQRYGFDPVTIRMWEKGMSDPDPVASQWLRMISADPAAALKLARKARTLEFA